MLHIFASDILNKGRGIINCHRRRRLRDGPRRIFCGLRERRLKKQDHWSGRRGIRIGIIEKNTGRGAILDNEKPNRGKRGRNGDGR